MSTCSRIGGRLSLPAETSNEDSEVVCCCCWLWRICRRHRMARAAARFPPALSPSHNQSKANISVSLLLKCRGLGKPSTGIIRNSCFKYTTNCKIRYSYEYIRNIHILILVSSSETPNTSTYYSITKRFGTIRNKNNYAQLPRYAYCIFELVSPSRFECGLSQKMYRISMKPATAIRLGSMFHRAALRIRYLSAVKQSSSEAGVLLSGISR